MPRRDRTVFDGLVADENLRPRTVVICPELIEAYEDTLAKLDAEIANKKRTKAAWVRLIRAARKALKAMPTSQ